MSESGQDTNPFVYGRELAPGELAGRVSEVNEVRDAILNGAKHFLIGPRRMGKTSVLHVGAAHARDLGAVVLRYNVEAFPDTLSLIGTIVADAGQLVAGPIDRAGAALERLFRALRPSLSYNQLKQSWTASLGLDPAAPVIPRLAEALDGLEQAATEAERPTGLVLDEIQQLVREGTDAEGQLRAAVQTHRRVGYVFSGSDTRLLAAMVNDPARPFYRLGAVRVLGPVPREEFLAFLAARFDPLPGRTTRAALDAILDEARDVPYNVQLLAHECWRRLRDAGPRGELTPDGVRAAHADRARQLDPIFSSAWAALTAPQRKVLQLLAVSPTGDDTDLFAKATQRRAALTASALQRAREGLVTKGICRVEARAGETRVLLEDPLFGCWIRETIRPL